MPTLIDVSDFRLFTVSFECRFSPAYLHWDRAGAIWSELTEKEPSLKLIKGEPNQTTFRLQNRCELRIQLDQLNVTAHEPPPNLDEFCGLAEQLGKAVVRHLGVNSFSRIGLRPVFTKEYPDSTAASAVAMELRLLWVPEPPCFGISQSSVRPAYGVRLEDATKGCNVQISVSEREFDFQPPLAWEGVEPKTVKKCGLSLDIDYYTIGTTLVGQLSISEWVKQSMHVVRRDVNRFLGGK